jgi:hypothetical protein
LLILGPTLGRTFIFFLGHRERSLECHRKHDPDLMTLCQIFIVAGPMFSTAMVMCNGIFEAKS